jgi:hypothetical protein
VTENHVYLIKKIKINYKDQLLINPIFLKDKIEKKRIKKSYLCQPWLTSKRITRIMRSG